MKMDWLYEQHEKSQAAVKKFEESLATLQEVVLQNSIVMEELKNKIAQVESDQAE